MKKLNVGIIGLGVGEKHIPGYQKHPNCRVVSLCDFADDKLAVAREKYPGLSLTKYADEIFEDPSIDIVSVASYDNYHYEQIIKGIHNNKHLFVEKPVCLYKWQAKRIYSLLQSKRELQFSSNLILRMSPRFILLKNLIKKGDFGRIFYLEGDYDYGRLYKITDGWRGKLDFYSVVYGGAVHLVDLILWLAEDEVMEVKAYGNQIASANSNFKYDDLAVCLLKFRSGALGKISANFGCVSPHFHALSVFGTRATFINDLDNAIMYEKIKSGFREKIIKESYPGMEKGDLIYNFVDSIFKRKKPLVTKQDIFNTMSVCFAIQTATKRKSAVTVDYLKDRGKI